MWVLSAVSHTIELQIESGSGGDALECTAFWRDITAAPTYVGGNSQLLLFNSMPSTFVASPAASTQRIVDHMSFFNPPTAGTRTINCRLAAGLNTKGWRGVLAAGERAEYENGKGWTVSSASAATKTVGETGAAGADGSDGALSVTEIEIDFGGTPVFEKQITVIDAGVSASSKIIATQSGKAATGKGADENAMDFLLMNCTPQAGQFVLNLKAIPGPVSGLYKINYQFS
jgi:hypothetical protein